MTLIHPTAIIDSTAKVADSASVGPFSVIGPNVEIGENCWIGPHVVISSNTRMGQGNKVYQFSSVGEDPQDLSYQDEETWLEIGDNNRIRESSTIHRGTEKGGGVTRIGNNNLLMATSHIAHDCQLGSDIVMANAASLAGHVEIGDHVILAGFALVHQFCKVGSHGFVAHASVVLKDQPPFVMSAGDPAKPRGINSLGLKRRGFSSEQIVAIKGAYRLLYRKELSFEDAKQAIAEQASSDSNVDLFYQFLNQVTRSIIR